LRFGFNFFDADHFALFYGALNISALIDQKDAAGL
jgi:hypothetical protein